MAEYPLKTQGQLSVEIVHQYLEIDDSKTLQEILERLKFVRNCVKNAPKSYHSVIPAMELYVRFITRAHHEIEDTREIEGVKAILFKRGCQFLEALNNMPATLAKLNCHKMITSTGKVVVTNGWNPCAFHMCKEAVAQGFQISVYVTEGCPDRKGKLMVRELRKNYIRANLILDCAAAHYIQKCDLVLVSAQIITTNCGILGKIGTATLVNLAHALRKPYYILSESYRFVEDFLIMDPNIIDKSFIYGKDVSDVAIASGIMPRYDFCPSDLVKRIYTDIGCVSPILLEEILDRMFV